METTLEEALDIMNRWAAADRTVRAIGEFGMGAFFVNGHLIEVVPQKVELSLTGVGIISFDPRNKAIDYSDVREAPKRVRANLEHVYDEALLFKVDEKNTIMLFALLETGAK
jgi:hypothetical protein